MEFPSPLWGGRLGQSPSGVGVVRRLQVADTPFFNPGIRRPPPRSPPASRPPHKGEGKGMRGMNECGLRLVNLQSNKDYPVRRRLSPIQPSRMPPSSTSRPMKPMASGATPMPVTTLAPVRFTPT
ncbi:MAG: hypothetical protein JWN07_1725 [Hyphomicrobiales bacterium]|nr:hypothetical protein [Hyphomicrobiales bacterium]